jgi:hypothetical protein
VLLIEYDHMVEQFTSTASYPPFRDIILPRAPKRSSLGNDPNCFYGSNHFLPEILIAVKNQVFVNECNGKCLPQLLYDPKAVRMARDIEMEDLATIM